MRKCDFPPVSGCVREQYINLSTCYWTNSNSCIECSIADLPVIFCDL